MLLRFARPLGLAAVIAVTAVLSVRADRVLDRVVAFCGKAATLAHAHGAGPVSLTTPAARGPYTLAVWVRPDVGTGVVYAVFTPKNGTPFRAPRDVRIAVAPASSTDRAVLVRAYPEPVAHGARFIAAVPLPRVDTWRMRVQIDGDVGAETVEASFASVGAGSLGGGLLLLYAAPFVLVATLWGPWRRRRRGRTAGSRAVTSPLTLTERIVT